MVRNSNAKYGKDTLRIISGILFFSIFFCVGVKGAEATPIKILSNSRHAYDTIRSTIDQLLGRAHDPVTEFVIHSTAMDSTYAGASANVALSSTSRYDESGALVASQAPYQIYTTSFTGYGGDTVAEYNLSATYDLTHNYAFTASTNSSPPAFHTAPGNGGWASASGVEWTIDPVVFCSASLSCLTAANAGIMAWLRFNHPTWNWFDVKAGLRQSSTNWATGYNSATYGFGTTTSSTTNAFTDNQILLQPPSTRIATSTGQIVFTVYPFKQTRRVKEVLFQFASNPGFQANELTLAQIQALGGTKITEYTGTTATTSAPIFAAVTNAYFVWFTADNSTDSAASFSRIDTYSVLGSASQNEISFSNSFNIVSPATNAVSTTASPTFIWSASESYLGISKYQLFIDGTLDKDNISSTSATPTSSLSDGTHTWYVKAFNGGGAATTTTSTPTININSGYTTGYTFYVDNVLGNDNNPGTQALPWATLSKAGLTAVAGDTVVIIKNANTPYRETLTSSHSGTSGSRVTFRGVDSNSKPEIWGSTDMSSGWSVYSGGSANTYQKSLTTQPGIVLVGASIASLTQKTNGVSETALNPGEWYWMSNVLYYRLASGESIAGLHIEAATQSNGIVSRNYTTYQNIVVRYANSYGATLSGGNSIAQGIEIYDSSTGFYVSGTNVTVKYSVAARNTSYGIFLQFPVGASIYNSIFYNNTEGGGYFMTLLGTTATIRNNVFLENGGYSFSFWIITLPGSITMSNNLWDTAGDSQFDTRKGTNNQELADPLLINPNAGNFSLQQFSPNIDAGTSVSLTTDILGNPIYGTPDIGGYEYQPPYSITSSGVPIGGAFRMYKNGKYRMTAATSSSATANMTIAPEGGFPSGDYGEYLNVAVNSWNTSGDYTKSWTESSSAATSTAHTIGDLAPNGFYAVSVDGTKYATFRADAGGQGTFTYSGGYSTHTFSIAQDLSVTNGPIVGSAFVMPSPQTMQISNSTASSTVAIAVSTTTSITASSTIVLSKIKTATSTDHITKQTSLAELRSEISRLQGELVKLLNKLAILLAQQLQNIKKTI